MCQDVLSNYNLLVLLEVSIIIRLICSNDYILLFIITIFTLTETVKVGMVMGMGDCPPFKLHLCMMLQAKPN